MLTILLFSMGNLTFEIRLDLDSLQVAENIEQVAEMLSFRKNLTCGEVDREPTQIKKSQIFWKNLRFRGVVETLFR
jgi:hypothetical protein